MVDDESDDVFGTARVRSALSEAPSECGSEGRT